MESYSSPIPTSPSDFLEGPSSLRHVASLDDYAVSFSYYLDREGAAAEPQIPGNEVSTSQPDDYISTSNAFGFVIQSLDYPPLPLDSPATRVAPPSTPLSYEIPPNKGPGTPPATVCPQDFFWPSPRRESKSCSSHSSSSHIPTHSSSADASSSSSSAASSLSSPSSSASATITTSSPMQHAFVAGSSSTANREPSPVRASSPQDVLPPSSGFTTGHAAAPTLQQPNLRRSVRQRASRSVKRGNEERGPAPAQTGKTIKRSFAAPTQPVASGSAMPQAGPSRTKEVPQRAPKRAIEDVDTAEDEPAPKKRKSRALKRSRSEVDFYKIPTDPCDCPVQGCGLQFGNSREDNVAHLRQHYGQNSLRYAKVNCLWPECDVQVPGNTLIDHVQEKHVGSVYRCPLSDTPGYKCIWTTPKSGYTGQHMRGIHGMEWPPVKKEPGVEP
ncbi:hypothetical protein BN946_scf184928.g1 [Trametes cinnabarina]|uniref:Uncharacterized protein n=1 Tax=Pycnoporus cinnabarinus TaxID=5643 RepID=A0A060SPN1_PYCCI|nr:hypothetical protein BN946_scf184928.g1 [Trametes cinnabarina]